MILTTCKYFDLVGNRCSRVTDGKCNDLRDCEFKYIEALKAENERLKKKLKNNKSAYEVELGTYNMECGNLLEENKQLLQTLQEIKAIAKAPSPYIDNFEIKTATEVGYDYVAICNELKLRLHKVLELITKAEEE